MRGARGLVGMAVTALVLSACGAAPGTGGASSCGRTWKVGLVTDAGGLDDRSFNQNSWQGVLDAQRDSSLCIRGRAIESAVPTDAPKNMQLFADLGYDVVVTVGALVADASVAFARAHPKIEVVQVDPTGQQGTPGNWVGLTFREDQAGFLAGALAGLTTKSGVIGEVFGLEVPAAVRYRVGFEHGARSTNPKADVRGVYQPACSCSRDFNDPEWGRARAVDVIGQGADVVFGAGGNTGNGALVAAQQRGKICIGVDVDEFLSFPAVASCLITSAEKHLSLAVRTALTDAVHGRLHGGLLRFDAANGGVGIAPYHDFDGRVPADVKSRIKDIQARLVSGALQTGVDAS